MNIAKKIQKLRKENRLTQEELANKVGLSRVAVTSIEQGNRKVSVEELVKFCEAFECSYGDFLSSDKSKNPVNPSENKKTSRELYEEYKNKYRGKTQHITPGSNPLDDYLRGVNPNYSPSVGNEVRYEQ
jgi:transcriptional regulator with XRE-family HTH domain